MEIRDPTLVALEQIAKGIPIRVKVISNKTRGKNGERISYRITIPKPVVEALGIKEGETFEVFVDPEFGMFGFVREEVAENLRKLAREGKLRELFGASLSRTF